MSFKLFIYYCALCGGWAALAAWGLAYGADLTKADVSNYTSSTLIAGLLGVLLAAIIGLLDSLLNDVGAQRMARVLVALVVGLIGGLLGGLIGEMLHDLAHVPRFFGWMLVGLAIGASVGVYDLLRAMSNPNGIRSAIRKIFNGMIGGVIGGLVGGILFDLPSRVGRAGSAADLLPRSSLAIGLVVLGLCIGLLIGLAQVILKEAWLRVEAGFRPGRDLMLLKPDTTIGRAESCDIGLFGDASIEKVHARVMLSGNRYMLADSGTASGTYLNDERVYQPTPLRSGDRIRVGNSVIRFGERQKRK
jgi:hypothetical protein